VLRDWRSFSPLSEEAPQSAVRDWTLRLTLIVTLLATAFGLYGRFRGLGKWPLGVDEFYIARSVDNLLRTGVPRFLCGGWYTRGLSYQYLVASVRWLGLSPELSGRLISALSSLIGLPAAYLIGRRLGGRVLGLLLLSMLLASVWEIEMARFARMYAPFQSIFLWYLLYFVRYTIDRDKAALWPMVALSVLGALTWEGGVLLGITNLLPPLLNTEHGRRLGGAAVRYIGGMLLLLVALLAIVRSLPFPSSDASFLPTRVGEVAGAAESQTSGEYAAAMALFSLVPLTLAAASLPWIWSLRQRWLTVVGTSVVLTSALLHQFILCSISFAILLLADLVTLDELKQRTAWAYCLTLLACAVFWLVYGVTSGTWHEIVPAGAISSAHQWMGILQHWTGSPNVFGEVIRPWGRTLPLLSIGALLLSAFLFLRVITSRGVQMAAARVLLIVLLVLILAVGARSPGRIETRYTFFLYPLVLAVSLAGLLSLVEPIAKSKQTALACGATASLLWFGLSGDFRPLHVATIDSWRANFRVGESAVTADHYYPRGDYRLAAAWLTRHVRPGDAVIIGIQSIDEYYHQAGYFFLQDDDARYDEDACSTGQRERWTNLPLIYRTNALEQKVSTGQRIFLVMYPDQAHTMLLEGQRRNWKQQQAWTSPDAGISVTLINPS